MSGFLTVLLQDDLCFSAEHRSEIIQKTKMLSSNMKHEEMVFYDKNIAFGYKGDVHKSKEQPYRFGQDRYCMMFAGEIFNKHSLQKQVEDKGVVLESNGVLEIVAALFQLKGTAAFEELNGMFAIAIVDFKERKLYGARDPFGIKPLYYLDSEAEIIVATDKKSVLFNSYEHCIAKKSLQHYLSYQYVPEPLTLTGGIYKLKPGHYFEKRMGGTVSMQQYFSPRFRPVTAHKYQMAHRTREVLAESIQRQMPAEGAVGSFLSGGIDSAIIATMAKEVYPQLKTFSVGFAEKGYSEIEAAKETADKLGLEHISHVITPDEFVRVLPEVVLALGDPLADPAAIPLFIAAREAKKHVDTIFSGEGADELFGGYQIYREPHALKLFNYIPDGIHKALRNLAAILPEGVKGKGFLIRGTTPLVERYIGNAKIFEEEEKRKVMLEYSESCTYQTITKEIYNRVQDEDFITQMQFVDLHTWLPGDILLKAEKLTKANAIELRLPFMDKNVFDVARMIPVSERIKGRTTKAILRDAFKGEVPDAALHRKKLGFPVPIKLWLKRELYLWAKQLIEESEIDEFISKEYVMKLLEQHSTNKGDYSRKIWTVLMFILWHQQFAKEQHNAFTETRRYA
ncbi:asparagine synthase (glutamine-hydrolyzing) [Virgibacillus sp. W0430]|uniref:asparagine synthase (glutamine-hydrolyzing) n=1 Tax=Virgibacillus sp. W0430 TaxID=3391580 RepID=UPI003F4562DC